MSHNKQEDSVLLNIKCDYIRRNHRKLIQKDSPGRLPRSTYLKLYQQLMLPAVQLDRLTDIELRKYSGRKGFVLTKTELKSENEKQRCPSKNIAENGSVYDFECEAYTKRTDFCGENLRLHRPVHEVGSDLNKKEPDEKLVSADQVKLARTPRVARPRQSNGAGRTKPRKRNPYAVIYKFLKGHKHLQSKLLATYKGTNSTRVAPFKIVINASSAGCKIRKIPLTHSDGLSSPGAVEHTLVKISPPQAATTTRRHGRSASSNSNTDKRKCFTMVNHGIDGQNVDEIVQSPLHSNHTCQNRKGIHDTSTSCDPRHKKQKLSGKASDSDDTGKDPDVTVGFQPTNGTYSSKVKCRNEAWERFNDARWNSVISPRKESLSVKAENKADSEQSKFELRRKSALEVIRDLFYETATSVTSVDSDVDNENRFSIGDEKDCNVMENKKNGHEECVLYSDDDSDDSLKDTYKYHEKDGCDSDAILNVVDRLIDNVAHKLDSESGCNQDVTGQTEIKTNSQHSDVESSYSLLEINYQGNNSPSTSADSLEDAPTSFDVQISVIPKATSCRCLPWRGINQTYTDSLLSTATEYVRSAYDIKNRNDGITDSTDTTSYGSVSSSHSGKEVMVPEDITVVVEELVGKVCEINDLCPKKFDARYNGDDLPTELEKHSTCDISTVDSCGNGIDKCTECQQTVADENEHNMTNKTGADLDHHINGLHVEKQTTADTGIFQDEVSKGNIADQKSELLTSEGHSVVCDAKCEANDEQLSPASGIIKPKACSMQNDEATMYCSESETSKVSSSKSEQTSSDTVNTSGEYSPSSHLQVDVTEPTLLEGKGTSDDSEERSISEQRSSLSSLQLKRIVTEAIQQCAASCFKHKDNAGEQSTTDLVISDQKSELKILHTEHNDAELPAPEPLCNGQCIKPQNYEILDNKTSNVSCRRQDERVLEDISEEKKDSTLIFKKHNSENVESCKCTGNREYDNDHFKKPEEKDLEQKPNFAYASGENNNMCSTEKSSTELEASTSLDIPEKNVSTDAELSSLLFSSKHEHAKDVEQKEITSVELHEELVPGRCTIISAESQMVGHCESTYSKCKSSSTMNELDHCPTNNNTDTSFTKESSEIGTATAEGRTKINTDIKTEHSLQLQTVQGTQSDKRNFHGTSGAQHNQRSLTKDENKFIERPVGDYGSDVVPNTCAHDELRCGVSVKQKAEDLKSVKDNTPNGQDETKENGIVPLASVTKQNSECEQWENASNDDDGLHIDIPDNDEGVNSDSVCRNEATISNSHVGDNEMQTLTKKPRKYRITRKNTKIPESKISEKQRRSKVECSKEQQEKKKVKRPPQKKESMTRRKLAKRIESVFSLPNSSSDQDTEDKGRKQKKKRNNGDTVLNSEDRLSVEFSKHNWILAKYKTTLQDAESEQPASEPMVTTLQTSPKPKRARRHKQISEEKVAKKKRTRRKQNTSDAGADNMPTLVDFSIVPSGMNSISNAEAEHYPNAIQPPDGNLMQVGDTTIDDNDNTGDIKILEVVSLADYIEQPNPNEKGASSEQNGNDSSEPLVNNHAAHSGTPETYHPLSMAINNSVSTISQLKQDEILRGNDKEDDTRPLDLRVKPAAETALDLSFKPERKPPAQKAAVGNEKETQNLPLDASYACFNIPKPANSAINAKRNQNPGTDTWSKPIQPQVPAQPSCSVMNPVMFAVAKSAAAAAAAAAATAAASGNVKVIQHSDHHQQKSHVRSSATIRTNSPSQATRRRQAIADEGQNEKITRCRSGENAPTFAPTKVVTNTINLVDPAVSTFRGKPVSSNTDMFVAQTVNTIPRISLSASNSNVPKTLPDIIISPNSANTVDRAMNTFPGEIMSPININPVNQPINTFHGNNLNRLGQSVNTFPSTVTPTNSAVPTLPEPLPAHSCNVLQPSGKSNTQSVHQPMELLPTQPEEINPTPIINPAHGANITGAPPPALPGEVAPQGRSLNSSAPYVHFSPGVITSDARHGNTAAHPDRSIPHTVKHFPQERLNELAKTCSGQCALPRGEPRRVDAGSGIIRQHLDGNEVDPSCFIVKPIVTQGMPSYPVAPYTQPATQLLPVPGAFAKSGESHQHTARAGFRQQLPRKSGAHLKESQQQVPKSQQLLLQKQQQQQPQQQPQQQQRFQRHHELQQLGQLNVINKAGNTVPEQPRGPASGPAVSYPGHNMPLPTAYADVRQPAALSESNNILFSTQDGGSVVCAIDSQDMRVVSINCEVCGSKAKFLCSNCKRVAYCSANCQFQAWRSHRMTCLVKQTHDVR